MVILLQFFYAWLPPILQGFVISLFGVFILYAVVKVLKLIWDILPFV